MAVNQPCALLSLLVLAGCLLVYAECTTRGNSTVIARTYEEARRECECICSDAFTKKGEEREAGEELEAEAVRSAWQTLLHNKRGDGGDGGGSSNSGGRSGSHESSGGEGDGRGSRDSGKRGGGAAAGMVESRARR